MENNQEIIRRAVFNVLDNHFIWIGDLNKKHTLRDYRLNTHFAKDMDDVVKDILKAINETNKLLEQNENQINPNPGPSRLW